jgi:methylated-DNA-[protein]-cysteine S-methyltransferase
MRPTVRRRPAAITSGTGEHSAAAGAMPGLVTTRLLLDHLDTPIGRLALVADEQGRLRALGWTEEHDRMERQLRTASRLHDLELVTAADPGRLVTAMRAYFDGELAAIDALTVETGGTEFQGQVWRALRTIPCGRTWSYGDLARQIGKPAAVRAVGLANGANPIAIVVPCHRVIGSDGSLTGYGGGLDRKRWLLAHEGAAGGELPLERLWSTSR